MHFSHNKASYLLDSSAALSYHHLHFEKENLKVYLDMMTLLGEEWAPFKT